MEVNSYQRPTNLQLTGKTTGIDSKGTEGTNSRHQDEIHLDLNEVEKKLSALNKMMEANNTHIKFTLHEELNEYYVQVINDQTMEVVREIPSKKVMDIVAKMHEMIGLLVDEKR